MPRFVRRGKIPFVPLFVFIVEIVMKVSHNETVLLLKKVNYEENNERNNQSIFKGPLNYKNIMTSVDVYESIHHEIITC